MTREALLRLLDAIPLGPALVIALTLGLAPFTPEPHILEKLRMLVAGELTRPLDWFDLVLHGAPWLILLAKILRMASNRRAS